MKEKEGLNLGNQEWTRLMQLHFFEQFLWRSGARYVAGIDEAGRGPLAGPLVAAAVVLEKELMIPGLNDSKCVPVTQRVRLAQEIKLRVAGWAVSVIPVGYIDSHNIHQATFMAMKIVLKRLSLAPDHVLVDGWAIPDLAIPQTPLVKGDARSAAIAAASLLAKTTRDAIMTYYSKLYPKYNFEKNKGYPTSFHLGVLAKYGPSPLHRRTFRVQGCVQDD